MVLICIGRGQVDVSPAKMLRFYLLLCFYCLYIICNNGVLYMDMFDINHKITIIAIKEIDGFNQRYDMNRHFFYDFGMDSLGHLSFIHSVEGACNVFIPVQLVDKLKSVSDVVVAVYNLKRVNKVRDVWIPCQTDRTRQCCFMANERNDSTLRSTIYPNDDFCNAMRCSLYRGWGRKR